MICCGKSDVIFYRGIRFGSQVNDKKRIVTVDEVDEEITKIEKDLTYYKDLKTEIEKLNE